MSRKLRHGVVRQKTLREQLDVNDLAQPSWVIRPRQPLPKRDDGSEPQEHWEWQLFRRNPALWYLYWRLRDVKPQFGPRRTVLAKPFLRAMECAPQYALLLDQELIEEDCRTALFWLEVSHVEAGWHDDAMPVTSLGWIGRQLANTSPNDVLVSRAQMAVQAGPWGPQFANAIESLAVAVSYLDQAEKWLPLLKLVGDGIIPMAVASATGSVSIVLPTVVN